MQKPGLGVSFCLVGLSRSDLVITSDTPRTQSSHQNGAFDMNLEITRSPTAMVATMSSATSVPITRLLIFSERSMPAGGAPNDMVSGV